MPGGRVRFVFDLDDGFLELREEGVPDEEGSKQAVVVPVPKSVAGSGGSV
jgi:hypothetical protein